MCLLEDLCGTLLDACRHVDTALSVSLQCVLKQVALALKKI